MTGPDTDPAMQTVLDAVADAGIGYAVVGRDGVILSASKTFLTHLNLSADEPLSASPWFHLDPAPPTTHREREGLWEQFIGQGRRWQGMVRWHLGNDKMRYFEGTACPQPDGTATLVSVDRSERIHARRRARETENLTQQMLEALPIFMCVTDLSYTVEYLDRFLPERLGLPAEKFIGRDVEYLFGPDLAPVSIDMIDQAASTKTASPLRLVSVANGLLSGTHWHVQAHPLRNNRGEIVRVMTTAIDRTDGVRLRNERIAFANAMHQHQRVTAINNFAGSLAHELSNLLQPISAYARLLEKTDLSDTQREQLAKINQSSLAAGRILHRTLQMSRTEPVTAAPSKLGTIIADTLSMARDLAPPTLTYDFDTEDGPSIHCPADEVRQVLLNLLNNAAEAMHYTGNITVQTARSLTPPTGTPLMPNGRPPFAVLSVTDTGGGIPASDIDRVFEPFFTTKPVGRGTGLGLAIVQGLAMSWGGVVTLDNRPEEGCTFHVWIPTTDKGMTTTAEGSE